MAKENTQMNIKNSENNKPNEDKTKNINENTKNKIQDTKANIEKSPKENSNIQKPSKEKADEGVKNETEKVEKPEKHNNESSDSKIGELKKKQSLKEKTSKINENLKNIAFNIKNEKWRRENNEENSKIRESSTFALEIVDVKKTFQKTLILKGCNFKVKKGAFHALVGENGAGKTTLIKTIIGGYAKYEGDVLYNGLNISKYPQEKSFLSYVPEKAIFPGNMNLKQYLTWISELCKIKAKESKVLIEDLLTRFDLTDRAKTNPNKLSSGQKKKIFLMKILIEKPKIIILDEPAANLDPTARYLFFEELKKLNDEGVTILITSHIVAEISKYVNEATFVRKGEISFTNTIEKNSLEDVFKKVVINSYNKESGW